MFTWVKIAFFDWRSSQKEQFFCYFNRIYRQMITPEIGGSSIFQQSI